MNEIISIIVPIYNVEPYLNRCIHSLINQTYKNLEIILINDGSTDQSGDICNKAAQKDSRIKVIHGENNGVSSARNIGLEIATGKYIGFVDSDDWIELNMYELLYKNIIRNNSDMVICDAFIESKATKVHSVMKDDCIFNKNEMFKTIPYNEGFNWLCNKLFKRELFNNVRLNEKIYIGEDILCICECICYGDKFSYISIPLYHYFTREDSAFNSSFNLKKLTNIDAYKKILYLYQEYAPKYVDKAKEMYIIANINVIKWNILSDIPNEFIIDQSKNNINEMLNMGNFNLEFKSRIKVYLMKINPVILVKLSEIYKKMKFR